MSSRLAEFTKGELVKMVTQKWVGRVIVGITDAIQYSFDTDEVLRPVNTRSEIERRFQICIRWFVTLRRDLHWSVPRILDAMKSIIRTELDSPGKWSPDERRESWSGPGNGSVEVPIELEVDGDDVLGDNPDVDGIEAEKG